MEHYQTQVKDIGVLLLESENLPDDGANKQTMRDRMKNHMNQQLQVKLWPTVDPKLKIKPICCVLNQWVLHLEQELLLTIAKESGRSEVRKLVRIVVNTGQCAQHKASELFQ